VKRIRNRQLRTSRTLLVITGSLLVALGALGLLLATEAIDQIGNPVDAQRALLNDNGRRLLSDHQLAFQIGALVVALVLIATGIVWLKNQIPPIRHQEDNEFDNPDPEHPGRNAVRGGALAHALEAHLETSEPVQRARAEFRTDDDLIRLRLDVDETVPLDEILNGIVNPAIDRITAVAELEQRPSVETDLRPVAAASRHIA
jgi:hypothetical protein